MEASQRGGRRCDDRERDPEIPSREAGAGILKPPGHLDEERCSVAVELRGGAAGSHRGEIEQGPEIHLVPGRDHRGQREADAAKKKRRHRAASCEVRLRGWPAKVPDCGRGGNEAVERRRDLGEHGGATPEQQRQQGRRARQASRTCCRPQQAGHRGQLHGFDEEFRRQPDVDRRGGDEEATGDGREKGSPGQLPERGPEQGDGRCLAEQRQKQERALRRSGPSLERDEPLAEPFDARRMRTGDVKHRVQPMAVEEFEIEREGVLAVARGVPGPDALVQGNVDDAWKDQQRGREGGCPPGAGDLQCHSVRP